MNDDGILKIAKQCESTWHEFHHFMEEAHGFYVSQWKPREVVYTDGVADFYTAYGRFFGRDANLLDGCYQTTYTEYVSEEWMLDAVQKYKQSQSIKQLGNMDTAGRKTNRDGVIKHTSCPVISFNGEDKSAIFEMFGVDFDTLRVQKVVVFHHWSDEFYLFDGRYFAENIPTGEKKFVRNYLEYESEHAFLAAIEKYKV